MSLLDLVSQWQVSLRSTRYDCVFRIKLALSRWRTHIVPGVAAGLAIEVAGSRDMPCRYLASNVEASVVHFEGWKAFMVQG